MSPQAAQDGRRISRNAKSKIVFNEDPQQPRKPRKASRNANNDQSREKMFQLGWQTLRLNINNSFKALNDQNQAEQEFREHELSLINSQLSFRQNTSILKGGSILRKATTKSKL